MIRSFSGEARGVWLALVMCAVASSGRARGDDGALGSASFGTHEVARAGSATAPEQLRSEQPAITVADMCKLFRRSAAKVRKSYGTDQYEPAVRTLVDHYVAAGEHPTQDHPAIRKLRRDGAQLLMRVAQDLERRLAHAPQRPARINHQFGVLAQQIGAFPAAGAPGVAAPGVIGGNAAWGFDYGQELVDLIHAVIAPEIWDVNGGPGSVVYYRPLQALVVRAPGEVHEQLGGALNGLRNAGP